MLLNPFANIQLRLTFEAAFLLPGVFKSTSVREALSASNILYFWYVFVLPSTCNKKYGFCVASFENTW